MYSDERPIIFFDSHPEQQGGLVYDSLSRFKAHLATAWTGEVIHDVEPSMVRLQWYTTDGNFGKRDYELREHDEARQGFETLCTLEDVSRCMIVGYPSQNPYAIFGESPFEIKERKRREIMADSQYKDFVPREKKGKSVAQKIGDIIDFEDDKGEKQEAGKGEEV